MCCTVCLLMYLFIHENISFNQTAGFKWSLFLCFRVMSSFFFFSQQSKTIQEAANRKECFIFVLTYVWTISIVCKIHCLRNFVSVILIMTLRCSSLFLRLKAFFFNPTHSRTFKCDVYLAPPCVSFWLVIVYIFVDIYFDNSYFVYELHFLLFLSFFLF